VGLLPFALSAPQPRLAHRSAEFPRLCLLCASDLKRMFEIDLSLRRVRLARHQRDFPGNATNLSLKPTFLCCFDRCHCFANAAPGIIELAEL
jgi:hypothetical protein